MERLKQQLLRMDGKGYKAYKDIAGTYEGNGWTLHIDHVQADPFAPPSRLRMEVRDIAVRPEWLQTPERRVALDDYVARCAAESIRRNAPRPGGRGKSGLIAIDSPGQEVLPRTAAVVQPGRIELRLSAGLPAAGRSILGRAAAKLLCEDVPHIVTQALRGLDGGQLRTHLELADQQAAIRSYLKQNGYAAFVANGSVLPRESGANNRPMRGGEAAPFQSPASLEVEIPMPHRGAIRGMGIRQGITLIVGGGYHGKSTLLKAIERGVYNHIAGDGREYVLTDDTACKIRAEDGRRVERVDISPFIANLPFGRDTRRFCSDDASGSTSQAANMIEAIEIGAKTLLIDEDTSATNFMIRDARMQRLVAKSKEPITPFVDKVRQLYEEKGVSTILVMGGSGDYFSEADTVILMDEYQPVDVTEEARRIAGQLDSGRVAEGGGRFGEITPRSIRPDSFNAARGNREKVEARGLSKIVYGIHDMDLSFVEQLVDPIQTRAIACMLAMLASRFSDGRTSLAEMADKMYALVELEGLDAISPFYGKHPGDLALPRRAELAAAVNRLRTLRVQEPS